MLIFCFDGDAFHWASVTGLINFVMKLKFTDHNQSTNWLHFSWMEEKLPVVAFPGNKYIFLRTYRLQALNIDQFRKNEPGKVSRPNEAYSEIYTPDTCKNSSGRKGDQMIKMIIEIGRIASDI